MDDEIYKDNLSISDIKNKLSHSTNDENETTILAPILSLFYTEMENETILEFYSQSILFRKYSSIQIKNYSQIQFAQETKLEDLIPEIQPFHFSWLYKQFLTLSLDELETHIADFLFLSLFHKQLALDLLSFSTVLQFISRFPQHIRIMNNYLILHSIPIETDSIFFLFNLLDQQKHPADYREYVCLLPHIYNSFKKNMTASLIDLFIIRIDIDYGILSNDSIVIFSIYTLVQSVIYNPNLAHNIMNSNAVRLLYNQIPLLFEQLDTNSLKFFLKLTSNLLSCNVSMVVDKLLSNLQCIISGLSFIDPVIPALCTDIIYHLYCHSYFIRDYSFIKSFVENYFDSVFILKKQIISCITYLLCNELISVDENYSMFLDIIADFQDQDPTTSLVLFNALTKNMEKEDRDALFAEMGFPVEL